MLAIIDGDIPCFTECAVAEQRGSVFGSYFPDITALADAASYTIELWAKEAGATDIKVVMSHPDRRNFRKHLLPLQYKVQRTKPKPGGYNETVDAIRERFDCFDIAGIEGDDTCGILHTSDATGETVTVSTDKDFKTLPGWLYNPNKMVEREWVTPNEATHFWMQQVLEGDAADGYKGCRSVGKVKALRAIGDVNNDMDPNDYIDLLWSRVMEQYDKVYDADPLGEAVMQARMARILHRLDYDREAGTIQLWHPYTPETFKLDSF